MYLVHFNSNDLFIWGQQWWLKAKLIGEWLLFPLWIFTRYKLRSFWNNRTAHFGNLLVNQRPLPVTSPRPSTPPGPRRWWPRWWRRWWRRPAWGSSRSCSARSRTCPRAPLCGPAGAACPPSPPAGRTAGTEMQNFFVRCIYEIHFSLEISVNLRHFSQLA